MYQSLETTGKQVFVVYTLDPTKVLDAVYLVYLTRMWRHHYGMGVCVMCGADDGHIENIRDVHILVFGFTLSHMATSVVIEDSKVVLNILLDTLTGP